MLKIENINKKYGKRIALSDINLNIEKGTVLGLLGDNGAGKTTLLRILSSLLCQNSGKVFLDDKEPVHMCGKISYITGEGSYFPSMKIGQYGEFLSDLHSSFDIARYKKLCDFFELESKRKIIKLSTGQRARVELAAGFAKRAEYIFMDEPFLGKDVFTRRDFLKLMSGALKGGETIVLCTHYIDEIENFIDRAIIMHKGKIALDITPDELHENGETLIDAMARVSGWDANRHIVLE